MSDPVMITVRLSEEDRERAKRVAARRETSLNLFIRRVLLWAVEKVEAGDCAPECDGCPNCWPIESFDPQKAADAADAIRCAYVVRLFRDLPSVKARVSFSDLDTSALYKAMQRCGMVALPDANGAGGVTSGNTLCKHCGQLYREHPLDWRQVGKDGKPYLNILCNGDHAKLIESC